MEDKTDRETAYSHLKALVQRRERLVRKGKLDDANELDADIARAQEQIDDLDGPGEGVRLTEQYQKPGRIWNVDTVGEARQAIAVAMSPRPLAISAVEDALRKYLAAMTAAGYKIQILDKSDFIKVDIDRAVVELRSGKVRSVDLMKFDWSTGECALSSFTVYSSGWAGL